MSVLERGDSEISQAIGVEVKRQKETINLIASENYASRAVLEAQGSFLTDKYAEGYPRKRYYGGCENMDVVEVLAIRRAKELFHAEHANVQPHSGAQANMAVYYALLKYGDTVMGMSLSHGGHLTHGSEFNRSGKRYHIVSYEVSESTEKLDYELEFGIYIGKQGTNIRAEKAQEYIAGYTIFNDVSARDALKEVRLFLGPAKGKDFDKGNVMGPCLVTPDELDVSDIKLTARINGEVWSEGRSSDMYWSFPKIIEYISASETLYPGDFIGSGTVADGCGDELDRWIQPGDIIEAYTFQEIERELSPSS